MSSPNGRDEQTHSPLDPVKGLGWRNFTGRCMINKLKADPHRFLLLSMTDQDILARVSVDPEICGGRPHIRGARISIAIILDALTSGLTPEQIIDHYPVLEFEDIRAAVAFANDLAEQNGGLALVGPPPVRHPL